MSPEHGPAIVAEGLGKVYQLSHRIDRYGSLRDALTAAAIAPWRRFRRLSGGDASMEDFWAVRDVSFDVQQGEVVGIVGRNGAGKSTLLKILSRIVEPTEGSATLRGRVASLLEVGTGFHPELSGRENIYMNGSILGMKKREIDAKFKEIVAFAEIEKFLDTPVKRYSSGMYVRLAFAVAAHLDPEILIVDEVLAVGDAEFQKRCLGKMKEISEGGGRTVLFVSHNMAAVSTLCTRALLLSGGRLTADGSARSIVETYLASSKQSGGKSTALHVASGRRPGSFPHFTSMELLERDGIVTSVFSPGSEISIRIGLHIPNGLRAPKIGIGANNMRGERIFAVATYLSPTPISRVEDHSSILVTFKLPALYPGQYSFDASLSTEDGPFLDQVDDAATFEVIQDGYLGSSHPYFAEMGAVLVPSSWSASPGRA
jgi:lipopolysaccharide transport system ATP-binding protein